MMQPVKSGKGRVTIRDVAREAGVSITTVSHALNGYGDVNETTRAKVLDAAKRLDYVPNENGRALGGRAKKSVAFMLAGGIDQRDPGGMTFGLMSGIYKAASEKNYDFEFVAASYKEQLTETFRQLCRRKNITGVVVFGLAMDMPYYQQISQSEIPCVLVDVNLEGENIRTVSVDNVRAAYDAVTHMLECGYSQIAMLSGKKSAQVSLRREEGYRQALKEHGISPIEEWIEHCGFNDNTAAQKAFELRQRYTEIDGFFCASDSMAIAALEGLSRLGVRVPCDVGIVGFDDYPLSKYAYGGITTVGQLPYEMGVTCGQKTIDMIEGREVSSWIEVEYTLYKRASTRKFDHFI